MSEKITLRLKADPSVVLQDVQVRAEYSDSWTVVYAGGPKGDTLHMDNWEPVPPPLPTGLGAVVRAMNTAGMKTTVLAVRLANGWWVGGGYWDEDDLVKQYESFTILSEGVEL